jgi:hypothetical protein
MRWAEWLTLGGCKINRAPCIFSLDAPDQWPYFPVISKGNQARLRENRPMSISHEILKDRIPMGGRDLSGAEISALGELGVIVPAGSKVVRCWQGGCASLDWMGSVHRTTKRGFKSTHILVSMLEA